MAEKSKRIRFNTIIKFFILFAIALLLSNGFMILLSNWLESQINGFIVSGIPNSEAMDDVRIFLNGLNAKMYTFTTNFAFVTLVVLLLAILLSAVFFLKPANSVEDIDFDEEPDETAGDVEAPLSGSIKGSSPNNALLNASMMKVEALKMDIVNMEMNTEEEDEFRDEKIHENETNYDSGIPDETSDETLLSDDSLKEAVFPDEMDDEIEDGAGDEIGGETGEDMETAEMLGNELGDDDDGEENGDLVIEKESPGDEESSGTLAHSYTKMVEALKKIHELEKQHSIELASANKKLQKEIIERKKAEAEIRYLSNRLISGIEEARKDLAQDLHDEFGQTLTALHLGLEALWNSMPEQLEEQKNRIDALVILIEQLGDKIRNISSELRPDLLDDMGLIPTIDWYVNEFSESHPNINLSFQSVGFRKRLPSDIELVLYRIFQESMNNIIKHAKAENVSVALIYSHPKVFMTIKDDGVGFDIKKTSDGIGLLGMRERAVSVSGSIEIHSGKNKGVAIRVELPVS